METSSTKLPKTGSKKRSLLGYKGVARKETKKLIMVKKKTDKRKSISQEELTNRIKELEENWKRALADYQNLEKRIKQEKEIFVRLATASVIDKTLGVLDDLDRANQHLKDEGLNLVVKRFKDVLESEGVKEINVEGREFDPKTMECVEMVAGPNNRIISVVQKGYTLNDQLIRPVKVKVGHRSDQQ